MAWIRACGSGKPSTKYLYKDGVQSVLWDTSLHNMQSDIASIGSWNLNPTNMNANYFTTQNRNRSIVTNGEVDLSNYNTINIEYSSSVGSGIATIDVSSISSGYVVLNSYKTTRHACRAYVVTQKDNFADGHILATGTLIDYQNTDFDVTVTKVWLEK